MRLQSRPPSRQPKAKGWAGGLATLNVVSWLENNLLQDASRRKRK